MLYRNYLEKLLGNRTKIAMLRSFYQIPNKIWSSRDLAKFIGIYNTTVLDNLVDLEEMGLVDIGMHGHVKTIKLNKESVDILLTEKQGYIVKMFGNELAPHIMSPAEFKEKQNAPFLREAKKNHIPIYGEWK